MLQRLFSRNVPASRLEDAVDHGKDLEERDALRERSAVILERLERKKIEARRIAIEKRQAAAEAAERARREAEEAKARAAAEQAAQQEAARDEMPAAAQMPAETASGEAAATGFDEQAQMPEAPAADETMAADTARYQAPADAVSAGEPEMTAAEEGPPQAAAMQESVSAQGGYFTESEALRSKEVAEAGPSGEGAEAMQEAVVTQEGMAMDEGHAAETAQAHYAQPEPAEEAHYEPAGDMNAAPAQGEFHEDPEVLEQIRKKAEEAKARIAARLQQMEAEGGAQNDMAGEHVDLGEDAPPMYDDEDDSGD